MNITKFRNSYLIDKAYRITLVSVTLTALAPLIATLVDGLFSSNLLGNDAFISVSVVLPLVNAVSVLTMICERGGSVLAASMANGYWEHRKHPFYTKLSMVDKLPSRIKFYFSLDYEQRNLDEMKKMIKLFADTCEMSDEMSSKMFSTIQVLFNNAQERRSGQLKYLDISLTKIDDGIQMTIKDCGRPYDPVNNGMDAASVGARSATYRYMFSMNVTTIVWNKI